MCSRGATILRALSKRVVSVCSGIGPETVRALFDLGSGLNRHPPSDGGGDKHGGQEVVGPFVVSGCDAPEVLDAAEHPFDGVAAPIGNGVLGVGMFARRVGRDDGFAASFGEPVAQLAGVVGAVGQELARRRHNPEQRRSSDEVMGVPSRQNQGSGPAQVVGQGVNLRRPTAPGGSDGVFEGPPFAPAAERWAFT